MDILGIPLSKKRLSDEEFVNKLRKGLRVAKPMRYLHAAAGIGYIVFAIWVVTFFPNLLQSPAMKDDTQTLVYATFGLAILFGIFVGMLFIKAGHAIVLALYGDRADRLLVECWDAAHKQDEKKS